MTATMSAVAFILGWISHRAYRLIKTGGGE